jgi:hypothetical protein
MGFYDLKNSQKRSAELLSTYSTGIHSHNYITQNSFMALKQNCRYGIKYL